ncbi:hypothetical protein SCE1572_26860 [Sorangium cellulosum So0157-2]|uniref:Uncharacterized protein n=1 Tax=Sorangium cellulosum So0157-2 TaxID=1254432 RepID=S4XX37_SORCE|nr:hypothetical protein SCE1572_26860 [Sorangium cellulosum So0157-2]
MRELHLSVTVDEVNLILEGVGLLPFARVYALVAKVQQQASQQLGGKPAQEEPDAT